MKATFLTVLLFAGAITLHAAETNPLATAKFRWDMSAESVSEFSVNGAVQLGVPMDGGGSAARFDGGNLVLKDAASLLKGLDAFTLYVRVKPDGKSITGTVLCQRSPGGQESGGFEISGWRMPFIERDHLTFQGMIKGGLTPMAKNFFPAVNIDQDKYAPQPSGWRDIVICKEKKGPLKFYLDGKLVAQRTKASIIPGPFVWGFHGKASPLVIGADADGVDPFRGWVDQVSVWDRALTDAELSPLFGGVEVVNALIPQPAAQVTDGGGAKISRVFGNGILTADTPVAQRYDWIDAKLPAFRDQLEKNDPHYPRYHLTLPGEQWNPIAFFHEGKHHVFFGWTSAACFGYLEDSRENIVWQHIVSEDLIHWTILPMPIRSPYWPNENGTFFVNDNGEVVVLYYGDRGAEPRMAVSRDADLVSWEAYPDLVTMNGQPKEYKTRHDPAAVFKRGDTWYQVSTTVRPQATVMGLPLYKSKDAIHWDYAGEFYSDATGRSVNECGQLFQLGGRDVFTSIHSLGKGETYIVGKIREDLSFEKQYGGVPDYSSQTYNCVTTTVDNQGRARMWRFMNIVRPFREESAAGFNNGYSLAREVRMADDGRLLFRPSPEIEVLRGKHRQQTLSPGQSDGLNDFKAASSEIQLQFVAGTTGETGIRLIDGRFHLEARYDHAMREIVLDFAGLTEAPTAAQSEQDNSGSGAMLSFRAGAALRGPVNVQPGQSVTLRFFSDHSIFELYANDELVISNAAYLSNPDNLKALIFDRNGSQGEVTMNAWEMQPLKWATYDAKK